MKKEDYTLSRRNFLGRASLLAFGGSLIPLTNYGAYNPGAISGAGDLWSELSPEEKKLAEKSKRAKTIIEIENRSCAERVLLTTIRSFKKPDKLVSFAASFGGGIKKGDLCGLLTGGFMSIGFASERLIKDEKARADWVKDKTNDLWAWWEERVPKHCEDLRPLYANKDSVVHSANFNHMCQRLALKLDEMFVYKA